MGEIRAKVRLENFRDRIMWEEGQLTKHAIRAADVEFVVDTGAVVNLLPQDLVEHLGLKIRSHRVVLLANDEKIELPWAGPVWLEVAGRDMQADCLVGPPGCEPLLGQVIMENLDLIPDPARRTLTARPESPYYPTVKMKSLERLRLKELAAV